MKLRIMPTAAVVLLGMGGGVRMSPLGTSATNRPDDRRSVWSSRRNENWQGKQKYPEKTCPSATLSTTNPTRHGLEPGPPRWEAGD
jgi:hypothetical protein